MIKIDVKNKIKNHVFTYSISKLSTKINQK